MVRINYYKWCDVLQDFRLMPLDDADPWTIEIARRFNGTNVSAEQVRELLEEVPLNKRC